MVSAGNEQSAGAPWSFRLFAASGLAPAWTAFLFAVLTITVFVAGELASGRPGRLAAGEDPGSVGCTWILGDYRIVPMAMVLIGYVIAARIYLARWTRRGVETAEAMYVSSIWRRDDDGWRNIFSQDTEAD